MRSPVIRTPPSSTIISRSAILWTMPARRDVLSTSKTSETCCVRSGTARFRRLASTSRSAQTMSIQDMPAWYVPYEALLDLIDDRRGMIVATMR